ncbi:MAG: hypothetical protein H5T45_00545 [Thermoplasmatales archaeon]|nr:hypothetical protein [Thermoplasmatales archaeon]
MQITLDLINRIRDEVLSGKPKTQVSRELKISYRLVKHFTKDIPRRYIYTKEKVEQIRKMVRELGCKAEVARRLGIPYCIVIKYTSDIKVRNKTLGERTWEMLKEIMEKGYVFTNAKNPSTKVYILRKHFPKIQWVRVKGKGIAFIPEKKEEAMEALLERINKKVWSYHDLAKIRKLFDVK